MATISSAAWSLPTTARRGGFRANTRVAVAVAAASPRKPLTPLSSRRATPSYPSSSSRPRTRLHVTTAPSPGGAGAGAIDDDDDDDDAHTPAPLGGSPPPTLPALIPFVGNFVQLGRAGRQFAAGGTRDSQLAHFSSQPKPFLVFVTCATPPSYLPKRVITLRRNVGSVKALRRGVPEAVPRPGGAVQVEC
jgi:hypothetical protein